MLKINPQLVTAVRTASTVADLYPLVQSAIELEHSTIPPYLTALFSIRSGYNLEATQIIGSVVGEEMLHMTIAANLMNAIGGQPDIDNPLFIPNYPGPLPMGIHSSLTVGLAKLSRKLVYEVFMAIEEPEHPIDIPVGTPAGLQLLAPEPTDFATIGDFYRAMKDKLAELSESGVNPFIGDPTRQVTDDRWYPADQLFPITTLETANAAIDVIVEQGEGTTTSPFDESEQVSHYYRFAEIVYGKQLISTASEPGWAYAGAPVPLDPAGIRDLVTDAKAVDYPENTQARTLADAFNGSYTRLLGCLHEMFNGDPGRLDMALSVMVEMHLTAHKLVEVLVPGTTKYASPTFEYNPAGT